MDTKEYELSLIALPIRPEGTWGSLDHAAPLEQMKAINILMQLYFGAEDWLIVRKQQQFGLAREI